MKTYIALFRGINVGGKSMLLMHDLVMLFKNAGVEKIKTYINSGNVVFTNKKDMTSRFLAGIRSKIKAKYGFEPDIQVLELKDLEEAISGNPFPESNTESLHVGYLASPPEKPDLIKLESLKKDSERFRLSGRIFYLYAPEGVGRSKLASNCEKILGVSMTDRNWRTVCKIRDLAYEVEAEPF
jgi:uncharacterized protein (DUF1697 family)